MGEIIQIGDKPSERKPDKVDDAQSLAAFVWSCAACGNTTFQLIQGGGVRCANCNLPSADVAHFDPREKP